MEEDGLLIILDFRNVIFMVRVVKKPGTVCPRVTIPGIAQEMYGCGILWLGGAGLVVGLGFKALLQPF